MALLAKLLFRGQSPWQRQKNLSVLLWSVLVGLCVGGLIVTFALIQNHRHS